MVDVVSPDRNKKNRKGGKVEAREGEQMENRIG